MFNDVINLITETLATDSAGDSTVTETTKPVFARVESVGMKEFYQAQSMGFKPEIKFVLADYYDYSDERLVEWKSKRYRVLRTYRSVDSTELELTCYTEVHA